MDYGGVFWHTRNKVPNRCEKNSPAYLIILRCQTEVQEIEFLEDDVEIQTKEGETYHGRFLVDASGYQSLIAYMLVPCHLVQCSIKPDATASLLKTF